MQKKPTAHDAGWRAIEHAAASDLDNALGDAIDIVDNCGLNTGVYSLVALGILYGIATGKRADRQRKQLPSVRRWPFSETKSGRTLYRQCVESGDFAPYSRAQARYNLEFDAIAGIKPPKRRVDRPTPASSYKEVIDRDLPRLSDTISAIRQNLVMLSDSVHQLAEREAVKVELLEAETT
jgi:hypothetical protein